MEIDMNMHLQEILTNPKFAVKIMDKSIAAAITIVEQAYVDEAPADDGDFKQGIEVHKNASLNYVIRSTAKNKGEDYPAILYHGTGTQDGRPDRGYTSGHVRAGTVLLGIGGIRPNKVAKRAREDSEDKFLKRVHILFRKSVKHSRSRKQ